MTKRKKLSIKSQKLVELMMVSGIPTASGYEERIRFSELAVVESGPVDSGVLSTLPEGNFINGWDVNVAGVGLKSIKRNIRYHKHAVSHRSFQSDQLTTTLIMDDAGIHFESQKERRSRIVCWS